jgi:putative nucleotidyltransferase with HDIG domain
MPGTDTARGDADGSPAGGGPASSGETPATPATGTDARRDAAGARLRAVVPDDVRLLLDELHAAGHGAYVVGGSLRDALLGRHPADWDLATDARPERLVRLFHGAVYENRFGTVAVRREDDVYEITTFRTEHEYADFRRPHRVEFGDDVTADLARRDFTVNALAWGRQADDPGGNALVDPFGGLADLEARRLRAVGDPEARFHEDALRMVRAVRLAATLELRVEAGTLDAIRANAALAGHLSGERIGAELGKLLAAPRPSVGLRLAEATGLLAVISPDLAAQRGIPQNKIPGEDLWEHTLRTVDAAPPDRPVIRLAALLHDIGKPSTLAGGRFHHHEIVGAQLADAFLRRLRYPRSAAEDVIRLVRHHMFTVDPDATDAAVRRFIKRIGRDHVDVLFALRRADDIGSGMSPDDPEQDAFRARVNAELAAEAALDRYALVIDGHDLMRDLDLEPGPTLGRILESLVDLVMEDPALNERATLVLLAQGMLADMDTGADRR